MSYITEPQPCNPWCTPKGKFDNLGGYGNYPALQEIHENDYLRRYMYHPDRRPCCQFTYARLHYLKKNNIHVRHLEPCYSECNKSAFSVAKDQVEYN